MPVTSGKRFGDPTEGRSSCVFLLPHRTASGRSSMSTLHRALRCGHRRRLGERSASGGAIRLGRSSWARWCPCLQVGTGCAKGQKETSLGSFCSSHHSKNGSRSISCSGTRPRKILFTAVLFVAPSKLTPTGGIWLLELAHAAKNLAATCSISSALEQPCFLGNTKLSTMNQL